MAETTLNEIVGVRGHFYRSVNVESDWHNQSSLDSYVVTPTARELAIRVASDVAPTVGSRAWSITGPFGTGKSAFVVFINDVLARSKPRHPAAAEVRENAGFGDLLLLPVMVIGRRSRLIPALLNGLARSLAPYSSKHAKHIGSQSETRDAEMVWGLFEHGNQVAQAAGYQGLAVTVDELGKFLEYAALHPEDDDVFVLQHLAEGAARSPNKMVLMTVLHSSFADYAQNTHPVQASEWQKVQGRFTDVAFHMPSEQLLDLLAATLDQRWGNDIQASYDSVFSRMIDAGVLDEALQHAPIHESLRASLPIHPVVSLLLWPLFHSKMAQNERSLFAFLTSYEPHGFQEFLRKNCWTQEALPPLYQVDELYDYVTSSIGASAYIGHRARHWAEIEHALNRLPANAPAAAASIIKAIGLIGLYGSTSGLKANESTIKCAILGLDCIQESLQYLIDGSFVVWRRHRGEYWLWEGSDIDLESRYAEAQNQVAGGSLAERIHRISSFRPVIARAHYVRTGTLRHFDLQVIDGRVSSLDEVFQLSTEREGDGQIIFVLAQSEQDRDSLINEAQRLSSNVRLSDRLVLFAFPRPVLGLEDAALDLEAWLWVRTHESALEWDPVARAEVRSRITAAQERLNRLAGSVFGMPGYVFEPQVSTWVHEGRVQPLRTFREFSAWVSKLCDDVYYGAPTLRNELINRVRLSSNAAKARRNLVEAMIKREASQRLGIEGSPPEATIYESMLREGGFHHESSGHWYFDAPSGVWSNVWAEVQGFLAEATRMRRPITDLYQRLQRPPYGMRQGPMPVLLLAALLAHKHEVALYEEGIYVPEMRVEVAERLLRRPELFSVRLFQLTESANLALQHLRTALVPTSSEPTGARQELISFVKPLVTFAAQLCPYARQTRRFDDLVIAEFRTLLMRASDPYELVFDDIPRLFNLFLDDEANAVEIARRLRQAVIELEHAYPALLNDVEVTICRAFGLTEEGDGALEQLRRRAQGLDVYATDQRMLLFLREIQRDLPDWREGLARVTADGKPATHWNDRDVATFRARISVLASDFIRLEELVSEHRRSDGSIIVSVGILNGYLEDARALINVPPSREGTVQQIVEDLTAALGQRTSSTEEKELRLAALARVLQHEAELKNDGGENE